MWIFCLISLKNCSTKLQQHNLTSLCNRYLNVKSKQQYSVLNLKFSANIPRFTSMEIDTELLRCTKAKLLQIYDASVSSVMPGTLIEEKVKLVDENLLIDGTTYPLTDNVYLVGFGKAVASMAYSLEEILGPKLKRGIVSVPRPLSAKPTISKEFKCLREWTEYQFQNLLMLKRSKVIEYHEGAENNQPDDASLAATNCIIDMVKDLGEDDTLIVLISGGGSALLFQPKPPITAEIKRDLCKKLQNAGASITELNCVRQQLSIVKGGGLAKIAYPAKVLSLVLSDIVGDPLEFIASGPTCPVTSENAKEEAVEILEKYKLYKNLDDDTKQLLSNNTENGMHEKVEGMIDNGKFTHVENLIIGSNATALHTAEECAKRFDLNPVVLTNTVEGDVRNVSFAYAKLTRSICQALEKSFSSREDFVSKVLNDNIKVLNITQSDLNKTYDILMKMRKGQGIVLLAGGEPTVVVEGSGKGGRNQEIALRFSLDWLSEIAKDPQLAKYFVLFLSASTDGQDGPTEAAGAFGRAAYRPKMIKIRQDILEKKKFILHPNQVQDLKYKLEQIEEMLPENVLKRNDSYNFFSSFECGENLVKTGLTGTNVMDLHFIYIKRRDCECEIQALAKDSKFFEDCDYLFKERVE